MIIIKEAVTFMDDEENKTYTHEQLVDAVGEELDGFMLYNSEEGETPDIEEMLDMLHDNQGIEAALSDHPQHEELISIIEEAIDNY